MIRIMGKINKQEDNPNADMSHSSTSSIAAAYLDKSSKQSISEVQV